MTATITTESVANRPPSNRRTDESFAINREAISNGSNAVKITDRNGNYVGRISVLGIQSLDEIEHNPLLQRTIHAFVPHQKLPSGTDVGYLRHLIGNRFVLRHTGSGRLPIDLQTTMFTAEQHNQLSNRPIVADCPVIPDANAPAERIISELFSDYSHHRHVFYNDLRRVFDQEPFENGVWHLSEQLICDALDHDYRSLEWLAEFCTDEADPIFAGSVLKCLGRQTNPGTSSWRGGVIRRALSSDDIEMRDAAVQAAESWGGQELAVVLKSHHEPEEWIREYIQDVIDDLGV